MFAQDSTLIGDVDCSGEVNSQDASLILQFVTNVIDELPCEANMTGLTPDQLQEMINMMEDQLNINYTAGSGGGCDYRFPEGLGGDVVTHDLINFNDYTVPSGKKLYILQHYATDNTARIRIDGLPIVVGQNNTLANPIVASSGQIISNGEDNQSVFNGFIVEETNDVQSITHDLINFNDYTVPSGKKLYILQHYATDNTARIRIDGLPIVVGQNNTLANPIVASSGQVISNGEDSQSVFNGYLVDEDYFTDCSSGGGSTTIGNGDGNNNENNTNDTDENGNIIGSVANESDVTGARVYYTHNYNIMETDEFGTFTNTLYDGEKNVYAMFLNKQTQILYWLEASNSSQGSGVFKKSSLSNFNPSVVGYFAGEIPNLYEMYVTDDEVIYFTQSNRVMKMENGISQDFLSNLDNVRYFELDESNDQYFWNNNYNEIISSVSDESIFSGYYQYGHVDFDLDVENQRIYTYDSNEVLSSFDYSGQGYTVHLESDWHDSFNVNGNSFDVIVENNNPTFFIYAGGLLLKCSGPNDVQIFQDFSASNYPEYNKIFVIQSNN